jgi:hypothetical protein
VGKEGKLKFGRSQATSRLKEVDFSRECNELDEKLIWENPARIFSLIAVHFPERSESLQGVARAERRRSDLVSFQSPKIL